MTKRQQMYILASYMNRTQISQFHNTFTPSVQIFQIAFNYDTYRNCFTSALNMLILS